MACSAMAKNISQYFLSAHSNIATTALAKIEVEDFGFYNEGFWWGRLG